MSPSELRTHSARGILFFFVGTTAAKLVSFVAYVVLAYLLSPTDLGIAAKAFTVAIIIQVFEQGGVGDVLVRRKNFRLWAVPGFWLALILGVACCALIILAGPLAARLYRNDQLPWLLAALAPSSIFNSLSVVPRAQLSRELRFRMLATVNLMQLTLRWTLTVAFAVLVKFYGPRTLGPYAYVVPFPIASAFAAAYLWWSVSPPWSLRPHVRRWRYMIGDSTRLLTIEAQRAVLDQSDYVLLGLFGRTEEVIGLYWYGFTFSIQMLQLFAFNLMNVVFPALTRLNDQPEIQMRGFLKGQKALALLGISSCFLQAAAAESLTHVLLDPQWIPAIIVMQILCLGMATRMIAATSLALLKSHGRFRVMLWSRWVFIALQIAGLCAVLSGGGGMAAVALVVAIVASLIGPITFYAAIRPYGYGWSQVAAVLVPPILSSGAAVGTAWFISKWMARNGFGYLPQLAEIVIVALLLGTLFARVFLRPVWDDLWARAWQMLSARFGRQPGSPVQ
jgi:O-antigen/teichoic acid export membrane protein